MGKLLPRCITLRVLGGFSLLVRQAPQLGRRVAHSVTADIAASREARIEMA
jgi:hypothetical protein